MITVGDECLVTDTLPEEIVHDIRIVLSGVIWEVAGGKHNDGVHSIPIVTWN